MKAGYSGSCSQPHLEARITLENHYMLVAANSNIYLQDEWFIYVFQLWLILNSPEKGPNKLISLFMQALKEGEV